MKPHASLQSFALAVMTAALLGLPLAGCKDDASPAGKNAGKAIREFKEETSSLKKADPPAVEAPPAQPEPEGIVHEGEIVPEPKDKGQQA